MKFIEKIRNTFSKPKVEKTSISGIDTYFDSGTIKDPPPLCSVVNYHGDMPQGALGWFADCQDPLSLDKNGEIIVPKYVKPGTINVDEYELEASNPQDLKRKIIEACKKLEGDGRIVSIAKVNAMIIAPSTFIFSGYFFATSNEPEVFNPTVWGFGWSLSFNLIYPDLYLIHDVMNS